MGSISVGLNKRVVIVSTLKISNPSVYKCCSGFT